MQLSAPNWRVFWLNKNSGQKYARYKVSLKSHLESMFFILFIFSEIQTDFNLILSVDLMYSSYMCCVILAVSDHALKLKWSTFQNVFMHVLCSSENARSLKHLCRLKIRDSLGRLRLRAPVFISFLPLPPSLKDYIRFKEYDIYSRGSMTEE